VPDDEKPYLGVVWIGDAPGHRFTMSARSPEEAREKAERLFGAGHDLSLWNEEDADQSRQ